MENAAGDTGTSGIKLQSYTITPYAGIIQQVQRVTGIPVCFSAELHRLPTVIISPVLKFVKPDPENHWRSHRSHGIL